MGPRINIFRDERGKTDITRLLQHVHRHGDYVFDDDQLRAWTGKHYKIANLSDIRRKMSHLLGHDAPTLEINEATSRAKILWSTTLPLPPPGLLNLNNGVFDANSKTLSPHHQKFGFTYVIPIEFDPNAKCPRFKKWLRDVCNGDREKMILIRDIFGYALAGRNPSHIVIFLYGVGRNGKTVLLSILKRLLGEENVSVLSLPQMSEKFLRIHLDQKLANLCDENPSDGSLLKTEFLKQISSENEFYGEEKGVPSKKMRFTGLLAFSLNQIPRTRDFSDAFRQRVVIVEFTKQYLGNQRIAHIEETFVPELSGVLNWALRGLKAVRENDGLLPIPDSVRQKTFALLDEGNSPVRFVLEKCEFGADFSVGKEGLYEAYEAWCQETGSKAATDSVFFKRVEERFGDKVRHQRPRSGRDDRRPRRLVGLRLCRNAQ